MININRILGRVRLKERKEDEGVFKAVKSKWKSKLQSRENFKVNSLEYMLLLEVIELTAELDSLKSLNA
jgi:hypothetical protein